MLVEQWRNTERTLAPTDHPLIVMERWREHAASVKLVLKHLGDNASEQTEAHKT